MILLRGPQRGNYNIYVSLFFRKRTYYYYNQKLVPTCALHIIYTATTAQVCGKRRRPRRRRGLNRRTYCLIFFSRLRTFYILFFVYMQIVLEATQRIYYQLPRFTHGIPNYVFVVVVIYFIVTKYRNNIMHIGRLLLHTIMREFYNNKLYSVGIQHHTNKY